MELKLEQETQQLRHQTQIKELHAKIQSSNQRVHQLMQESTKGEHQ